MRKSEPKKSIVLQVGKRRFLRLIPPDGKFLQLVQPGKAIEAYIDVVEAE